MKIYVEKETAQLYNQVISNRGKILELELQNNKLLQQYADLLTEAYKEFLNKRVSVYNGNKVVGYFGGFAVDDELVYMVVYQETVLHKQGKKKIPLHLVPTGNFNDVDINLI